MSFSLWHNTDVVREIYIDIFSLKDKIKDYVPESSFRVLDKARILKIIAQKEQKLEAKANLAKHFKEELGADIGDYVLVKSFGKEEVGIRLEQFDQEFKTNALKNKDQVIRFYKERLSIKDSRRTGKK